MIASDFSPTHVLQKGRWLMAALVCLALVGCASTSPQPFKEQDVDAQNIADRQKASVQSTPVTGPLSLQEAMARALKYNLQQRVRLLEEALALKQLDVNQLDMLPYLLAKAGYSSRDNDRLSLSRDIATGAVSTTQAQRDHNRPRSRQDPASLLRLSNRRAYLHPSAGQHHHS
jgi:outer membrane protein TolC